MKEYTPTILLFSFIVIPLTTSESLPFLQVNTNTNQIQSKEGMTYILHGVNSINKLPPYYPDPINFSPEGSLNREDMQNLKKWGVRVVRLGVMWPGVNPERDVIDQEYLSIVERLVNDLGDLGIYSLVDPHQDLLNHYFCGEGVPNYLIKELLSEEHAFPWPFVMDLKKDKEGFPDYLQCRKRAFFNYYLTDALGRAFVQLYTTGTDINLAFHQFWAVVAQKFKGNSNVVGYELINEPWMGNFYDTPLDFLNMGAAERRWITNFYEELHNTIRKYDDDHIIFFEPSPFTVMGAGFISGPGGSEYRNRQVYSYHVYCPLLLSDGVPSNPNICHLFDTYQMDLRLKETKKYGCGGMLTEFGALTQSPKAIEELNYVIDLADKAMHGFIYWQFKNDSDITTQDQEGEGFYYKNGTLQTEKVKGLSRSYPMEINGDPLYYKFDVGSGEFSMEYLYGGVEGVPTKIYFNSEMIYKGGIEVKLSPGILEYEVDYENGYLYIYHKYYVPKGTKISLQLKKKE